MRNNQQATLPEKQKFAFGHIRLEAESLSNQLYFLEMALTNFARESNAGRSLNVLALRGLCNQLSNMEEQVSDIFTCSCEMLGVGVDTVAGEWK